MLRSEGQAGCESSGPAALLFALSADVHGGLGAVPLGRAADGLAGRHAEGEQLPGAGWRGWGGVGGWGGRLGEGWFGGVGGVGGVGIFWGAVGWVVMVARNHLNSQLARKAGSCKYQ